MNRREVIAGLGSAAAWPLAARAQQPMPAVGYLSVGEPDPDEIAALRKGLSEQGYFEGRNFVFEPRSTEDYNRLPALANELVARRVAVIFIFSNLNAAQAAKAATSTIPIVLTLGADPVVSGLVASLNKPGGNVTGATFFGVEMEPKRLQLLHELVPQASTIAFLVNPAQVVTQLNTRNIQSAARSVGQSLVVLNASTPAEIEAAFATLARERVGGLLVEGDSFFVVRRSQLIDLAERYAIPAIYVNPEWAADGALIGYGASVPDASHQAGLYVGRILKGEKPADLPVVQSTKFKLAINLKTAKALGLSIPPNVLVRADEVIE
jgi:putative tryptophan/tyrosine transport system substrate-binding protein